MAERSAARAGKPGDAGSRDPFAELTRIIGFDPRVKILKPAEGARPAAAPPAAEPPATDRPVAKAFEAAPAERADEWESEFADVDFGLKPADPASVRDEPAAEVPAVPAPVEVVAQASAETSSRVPAAAPAGLASFETAEEIDEITAAFEREWHAKAAWSPTTQAVAMQPMPAAAFDDASEDAFGGEDEPHEAPAEGGGAELFGSDLDDVLAASMELELEDDWLDEAAAPAVAEEPVAAEPPVAVAAEPEVPAPVAPVEAAAPPARETMDFEEELAALLGAPAAPRKRPETPPRAAPAPVRSEPVRPATLSQAPAVPPEKPASRPEMPARAEPAPAASVRPAPARAPDPDDDPFAALAAMAARFRAGQTAPKPVRSTEPAPPAPPTPAAAEAAEPKQEPEADTMKRPSPDRYDTPEIDTVALPEHPVATADDLDIPANSYGTEPAARGRYEYDDEFDDLIQEMSSGERAIQPRSAAPAPRQASQAYAPVPRRAEPRPAMPRAATIPEPMQRRAAPPAYDQAQFDQARFDQDWDDYAAPARAEADYADDDADFADERAPAKPERKRGRWFAALFGSVAIVAAGGAYALKFTGAAESGGPVLVKADASPLKIRPENPGGAAVPNQENQVYDRVAGLGNTVAPQEKLLSSAEEPVSLDEPEEASDEVLPGLELSGDDMSAEGEIPAELKSEERVEADADATAPDDAIAVAPRKVRTMVVKPDGTLAPREEATPAVQALASNAADVLDTVKKGSLAAGVDMTESTASVTPSADDAAAGPASAEADGAQPAVMQASGEWTVQIASQPSEAGARSSYADLAKRYSAVLSGRPASIVKADVAGKGTVWRVRVAAEDRSEAAALCTSYKAAGGSCFVTK